MREGEPNQSETGHEYIPTAEEVHSVFRELTGKEYKEIRKLEDEKGIYVLEITVPGEEGETIEYAYMRKGRHDRNLQVSTTEIHVAYYDKDGEALGGTSVARLVDGKWKIL